MRKKTPDCWKQKNGRSGNNVQDKHREKVNRIGEIQSKHTDATSCATEVKDKTYIQTVDAHECVTSIEREESLSDRPTKTVLSKSKKKNMQKSHLERPPKDDNSDDLDSFLADLTKQDNSCHFPKCKTSTSVLGQICSHCTKRYCLGHFIPEVHGCGDLARAYARQQIRKEGIVTPGSGSQNKKPDPVKRLQLERTLEKKLDELGRKRSKKPSKS